MNKYYEAIRFIEETLLKPSSRSWATNEYAIERAINVLYELLDLYTKEKGRVTFK